MNSQAAFLLMWVIVAVVGLILACAAFVWAVRRRQFSDQDRARWLPLGGKPESKRRDSEDANHVSH